MSLIYPDMRECRDHLLARYMAGTVILKFLNFLDQEEHVDEVTDGLDSLWDLMDTEQQRLARLHSSNLNKALKGSEE